MYVTFDSWTQGRQLASLGTNAGALQLPFQAWRHFKEAFAPELIYRAVKNSPIPVHRCLDPFGGSGTTALACQFLGIHPITVEVNPYLADLIEAKLTSYNTDAVVEDLSALLRRANREPIDADFYFLNVPNTFVEPGIGERWIFDREVANRIASLINAIEQLSNEAHRRLFRVLLGGILIDVSNVIINGKGRRYRRGWEKRRKNAALVDELFAESAQRAIVEIHRYAKRACCTFNLHRGDCRSVLEQTENFELAVFSPPYPNSFDYTDVYNVELWVLGYLSSSDSNRNLRDSTLCSHVQIARGFPPAPSGSRILDDVIDQLNVQKTNLWNRRIPSMVGGYFSDIMTVLDKTHRSLAKKGTVWMVVGDSRYVNVHIKTAEILAELAPSYGWRLVNLEPCRSMRASAQQGGRHELAESLIVLSKF